MATLTGPEWKVLSKIIRETFGWHRDWKNITLTDFEKSCGMARNSVLSGVEGLLKKNLIKKKQKGPGNHLESYYQIVVGDKKNKKHFPSSVLNIAHGKYFYDLSEAKELQLGVKQFVELFFNPIESSANKRHRHPSTFDTKTEA